MKKKTKYRLQVLLDIREKNKRKAEIELGKAIAKLKEEEKRLEELKEEKEKLKKKKQNSIQEMSDKLSSGESLVKESQLHVNFLRKITEDIEAKDKEIEDQKEVIEQAKQRVAEARREYIDACKLLQIMEKHKELWEKKLQKKLSMAEEKQLGELGNVIHTMKKGASV